MSVDLRVVGPLIATAINTQDKLSNGVTQRYVNGAWTNDSILDDPPVLMGAALHAAELWRATGKREAIYFDRATAAFDYFVATYQNPAGYYIATDWPATQFALQALGPMYLILADYVAPARRSAWQESLRKACAWMVTSNNTTWYANGNIIFGTALGMWTSAVATGDQSIMDTYERVLRFSTDPTLPRWDGFGLRFSALPTRADYRDGQGYLTEWGASATNTLDWGYTQFQASLAARLWFLNRDSRVLALANLFTNQVLLRTDRTTWNVDGSGGSRHTNALPFMSCALAILAWHGGRDDLAADVAPQVARATDVFQANAVQEWGSPGIWRSTGLDGGGILAAVVVN